MECEKVAGLAHVVLVALCSRGASAMRAESRGRSRGFDCAPSNAQHIGVEGGITSMRSAVGESRTPNDRRELAPWRGQPPHGVTERHAPPRPSGEKVGEGERRKRCLAWGGFRGGGRSSRWCDKTVSVDPRSSDCPPECQSSRGAVLSGFCSSDGPCAYRSRERRLRRRPSKGAKGHGALRLGGSRCG